MEKAFVVRCKEFFGMKDGQSLQKFKAELNQLSDEDKRDLVAQFNAQGMPTSLPMSVKQ